MRYDKILVPLDGSQLAEYILPHVEYLASAFHSEVILFHVIVANEADVESLTPSQRKARADITRYLEHVSEALARKHVKAQWRVSVGEPAREIIRQASDESVDLVMMSTHGQGRQGQRQLGSVAMAVVSSSGTPVTIVRPPDEVARR